MVTIIWNLHLMSRAMSEQKFEQVIGWSIIIGISSSLLMCLNLYRQVGNLEYKVTQLQTDVYAAIQTLSTDVYTLKNSQPNNRTGEFE